MCVSSRCVFGLRHWHLCFALFLWCVPTFNYSARSPGGVFLDAVVETNYTSYTLVYTSLIVVTTAAKQTNLAWISMELSASTLITPAFRMSNYVYSCSHVSLCILLFVYMSHYVYCCLYTCLTMYTAVRMSHYVYSCLYVSLCILLSVCVTILYVSLCIWMFVNVTIYLPTLYITEV